MKYKLLWLSFLSIRAEHNQRTIANAPAGYRGFYTLGISSYIKRNYDLIEYKFCGASAGAGNSLYLTFKGDDEDYVDEMLDRVDSLGRTPITRILKEVCDYNVEKYTADEFDLDRLSIGVTTLDGLEKRGELYDRFDSLQDAVSCTASSSNIPFVSGSPLNVYRERLAYDGVFCQYPVVYEGDLLIEPWMWREAKECKLLGFIRLPRVLVRLYEGLFGSQRHKARELYELGWSDAEAHQSELDACFFDR